MRSWQIIRALFKQCPLRYPPEQTFASRRPGRSNHGVASLRPVPPVSAECGVQGIIPCKASRQWTILHDDLFKPETDYGARIGLLSTVEGRSLVGATEDWKKLQGVARDSLEQKKKRPPVNG